MKVINCISIRLDDIESLIGCTASFPAVEIRLDLGLSQAYLAKLPAVIKHFRRNEIDLIATCRRKTDGGEFGGLETERISLLQSVIDMGAAVVDLEFATEAERLFNYAQGKCRIILSYHNVERIPDDLMMRAENISEKKAWLYKIVCNLRTYNENLQMLRLNGFFSERGLRASCFGMGRKSLYSRAFISSYGGSMSYYGKAGGLTAQGQFSSDDFSNYRLGNIDSNTACYGIVGNPISHSLSPYVHNRLFEKFGINAVFLPFEVDDLKEFFEFAEKAGIAGLAVTYPYKNIELYQDKIEIDEKALSYKSGNTIFRRKGKYYLTDTDYEGFARFFTKKILLSKGRAVIIGTGNTARKIYSFLNKEKWQVALVSRRPGIKHTAGDSSYETVDLFRAVSSQPDILINTAPTGAYSHDDWQRLLGDAKISPNTIIIDVNYGRNAEAFLNCGCFEKNKKYDGKGMFIEQAALQFGIWAGREPDRVVRDSAEKIISVL